MIKNSVYCLLILISLLSFSACKKDFLERAPSDLIDEEKVFSNLNNAEAFLNNAYREVPQLVYRNYNDRSSYFNLGSATDEGATMWGHAHSTSDFNNGNWNSASFPLDWAWFAYYSSIRKINVFLRNYDLIPEEVGAQATTGRKKRLYGEAHGLRAYYYFLLYKMWGEVPIVKEALLPGGGEDANLARSPVDELIAFMDSDLQVAIENLPATHSNSEFGRFTATAAKALLSRLHLYYASELSSPVKDIGRWEKAELMAKQAINFATESNFALSLNNNNGKQAYERIFLEMNNEEIIWSSSDPIDGNGNYWDNWASSLGYGGWYGEGPIQEMVDSYEMRNGEIPVIGYNTDGSPIVNPASGYDPAKPFENRDLRFYQTVIYHGATWKGRKVNVAPGGADFSTDKPRINYFWRKYTSEDHNLYSGAGFTPRRFAIFRFSELLLNYAEARNEILASPDIEVYNAVNQLRARAGLPDLPLGLSQKDMREKIRHERKIELVMENHRFWDVRRWMIAEVTDSKSVHSVNVTVGGEFSYLVWGKRVFEKNKHYLFPIPQKEIEKSRGVLIQNPGW